jgi:hypothetical protein
MSNYDQSRQLQASLKKTVLGKPHLFEILLLALLAGAI